MGVWFLAWSEMIPMMARNEHTHTVRPVMEEYIFTVSVDDWISENTTTTSRSLVSTKCLTVSVFGLLCYVCVWRMWCRCVCVCVSLVQYGSTSPNTPIALLLIQWRYCCCWLCMGRTTSSRMVQHNVGCRSLNTQMPKVRESYLNIFVNIGLWCVSSIYMCVICRECKCTFVCLAA